jgi:hypothetical protein
MRKYLGIIVIVFGLLSGGMFFNAGINLNKSGNELTQLRSRAGQTVAEAYYQEIGRYGVAYSIFSYALGLGVISTPIGLGGSLVSKEE